MPIRLSHLLPALLLIVAACADGPGTEELEGPTAEELEAAARPTGDPDFVAIEAQERQRRCMALALYHEARGEGQAAMEAVGHVIKNRKDHEDFPGTICAVVRQGGQTPPCQFSFWCDGRSDEPRNPVAFRSAQKAADRVLSGASPDPTGGALYFHAERVSPSWASSFRETHRSGGHIFLAE